MQGRAGEIGSATQSRFRMRPKALKSSKNAPLPEKAAQRDESGPRYWAFQGGTQK